MTWSAITPDDSTYLANEIHTQIQNDKTMIRERLEASDGTIEAHYAASSEDSGKHQPSLTGFCKVHADYTALAAFTPRKESSLHAVLSPKSLYTVDSEGSLVKIYPVDHDALDGLDDDDHTQYQTQDLARQFSGDLTVDGLEAENEGSGASGSLAESHRSDDWETAHGAASLGNKHFANKSISPSFMALKQTSASGYFTVDINGEYGFPWMEVDNSAQTQFWYLTLQNDNTLGFAGYFGSWMDATIGYGKFSGDVGIA